MIQVAAGAITNPDLGDVVIKIDLEKAKVDSEIGSWQATVRYRWGKLTIGLRQVVVCASWVACAHRKPKLSTWLPYWSIKASFAKLITC